MRCHISKIGHEKTSESKTVQELEISVRRLCLIIASDQAERRLDQALAGLFSLESTRREESIQQDWPVLSRTMIKKLIQEGKVSVNDRAVDDPARIIHAGDKISVDIPPPEPSTAQAAAIPLDICYEDRDILVLNKPAGRVVHPAPGNREGTLVNALLHHCGPQLSAVGSPQRPGIVHRLDKMTSGLMVVAKTPEAYAGLIPQFAAHTISRQYQALVWGRLALKGTFNQSIGRDPRNRKRMAAFAPLDPSFPAPAGKKPAVTHYTRLEEFLGGAVSLIACQLMTGRTHQIRVHLSTNGHPLVGDKDYAKNRPPVSTWLTKTSDKKESLAPLYQFPRQALHATELGFLHPVTSKSLAFSSDLPDDFKNLLAVLRP